MISKVNSVSSMAFKGVWGDIQLKNDKPEVNYYLLQGDKKSETQEETKALYDEFVKKMESEHISRNPNPKWYESIQKVKINILGPLQMTKNDLEKFNRGFMSDTLAKMLLK